MSISLRLAYFARSELVEPTVTQEFYEISKRGARAPEEVAEFSAFLKKYIASWAGEADLL